MVLDSAPTPISMPLGSLLTSKSFGPITTGGASCFSSSAMCSLACQRKCCGESDRQDARHLPATRLELDLDVLLAVRKADADRLELQVVERDQPVLSIREGEHAGEVEGDVGEWGAVRGPAGDVQAELQSSVAVHVHREVQRVAIEHVVDVRSCLAEVLFLDRLDFEGQRDVFDVPDPELNDARLRHREGAVAALE